MSLSLLAAFWAVSFLFVITPGMDWAYIISAGMRGRRVMAAATGLLSGHLAATLVVAAGVGGLLSRSPGALSAITMVGATYLLWLGFNMVRHPPVPQSDSIDQEGSWTNWALKGFGISGLNPKLFLLFLALMPQFTDPQGGWPVSLQILVLGAVHIVSCTTVYLAVGFSAQAVLKTRPVAARFVSRFSGVAMIIIAAVLFFEQARP